MDRAADERRKAEEHLQKAIEKEEAAKAKFRAVMDDLAGLRSAVQPSPTPSTARASKPAAAAAVHDYLKDEDLAIKWRIAFHLLTNDGRLQYRHIAEQLWGQLERETAKNRVNSHMQQLKGEGIVSTLGGARYKVNQALLAEKSGRPIPTT